MQTSTQIPNKRERQLRNCWQCDNVAMAHTGGCKCPTEYRRARKRRSKQRWRRELAEGQFWVTDLEPNLGH